MKRIFDKVLYKTNLVPDPTARSLVSRFAAAGSWSVVTFTALGTAGVDISPALTVMGITGATVGFAAKEIAANLMSSLALAFQRPFGHGTKLRVGNGPASVAGTVDHWDLRYLYLKTDDGKLIHVPNFVVYNSVLIVDNPREASSWYDADGNQRSDVPKVEAGRSDGSGSTSPTPTGETTPSPSSSS